MQTPGELLKLCTDSNMSLNRGPQSCKTTVPYTQLCHPYAFNISINCTQYYVAGYPQPLTMFSHFTLPQLSIDLTAGILKLGVVPHISSSCADGVSVGPLSVSKNA